MTIGNFFSTLCKTIPPSRSNGTNSQFTGIYEVGRDPAARNLIVYFNIQESFYETMSEV
jgi:hypothetical protein